MDETQQGKKADMSFFPDWMKSGTDMWASLSKVTPGAKEDVSSQGTAQGRPPEPLEAALKMWQSVSAAMTEPAMTAAAVKGMDALPEVFVKMAQASWDACFQMQKSQVEKVGKISKQAEAYSFENVDQGVHKAFQEIYEKEIRQFFYIPQLGLTRFYQERVILFMDKLNLLETASGHFFSLFNRPFEQTSKVMHQELERLTQQGKVPKETKEYYNLWIGILEGHFMTLCKSPEYSQMLADLFTKLSEFIIAKNEVLQDILQILPVPTYKEIDELYEDLRTLKKKVRELEKQVNPT